MGDISGSSRFEAAFFFSGSKRVARRLGSVREGDYTSISASESDPDDCPTLVSSIFGLSCLADEPI